VAIARLLIAPRPLWLLDEPTAALDAAAEATLGRLIGAHAAAGGLAVIATHRDLPVEATATLRLGV
jgi:heme exporter protein A